MDWIISLSREAEEIRRYQTYTASGPDTDEGGKAIHEKCSILKLKQNRSKKAAPENPNTEQQILST